MLLKRPVFEAIALQACARMHLQLLQKPVYDHRLMRPAAWQLRLVSLNLLTLSKLTERKWAGTKERPAEGGPHLNPHLKPGIFNSRILAFNA